MGSEPESEKIFRHELYQKLMKGRAPRFGCKQKSPLDWTEEQIASLNLSAERLAQIEEVRALTRSDDPIKRAQGRYKEIRWHEQAYAYAVSRERLRYDKRVRLDYASSPAIIGIGEPATSTPARPV